MRWLPICTLFLLPILSVGQNLVPNPSFEDTIFCPFSAGDVNGIEHWIKVKGSVDYFHPCGINGFSVPTNKHGFQEPFDRLGYVGIANWAKGFLFREFLGVSLSQPLQPSQRYLVKYHLSMADTVQYALRNFGMLFTEAQPPNDVGVLLSAEPQVVYEGEDFLDDQEGWMTIEGSFIAEGGEQFLTLGNFDDDANTDTLFVVEQTSKSSYYYLDDVSVVEDTSYHVGVEDNLGNFQLEVYPNPNNGDFTIQLEQPYSQAELVVWDVSGKTVLAQELDGGVNSIQTNLKSGLYLYGVLVNGQMQRSGKISVIED